MKCKYCNSKRTVKKGFRKNKKKYVQKWFCKECKRYFCENVLPKYRHNPSEIAFALVLYKIVGLSLEKTSIVLKKFGIDISPSGIRKWIKKFGRFI